MTTCNIQRGNYPDIDPFDGVHWQEYCGERGRFSAMFARIPSGCAIALSSEVAIEVAIEVAQRVRKTQAKLTENIREMAADGAHEILFDAAHGEIREGVDQDYLALYLTGVFFGLVYGMDGMLDAIVKTLHEHGGAHVNVAFSDDEVDVELRYPDAKLWETLH